MDPDLIRTLQARQCRIRDRWEVLLRAEVPKTPLAYPDILVRLFDSTLGEVFDVLLMRGAPRRSAALSSHASIRAACACGRNPFLAYFMTGERALLENLMLLEAHKGYPTAATELYVAIHQIARREVETFCSVCQHKRESTSRNNFCEDNAYELEAVAPER